MRYRVKARGGGQHPDLDYETDLPPADLGWKYQYVSIASVNPITREMIDKAMQENQG